MRISKLILSGLLLCSAAVWAVECPASEGPVVCETCPSVSEVRSCHASSICNFCNNDVWHSRDNKNVCSSLQEADVNVMSKLPRLNRNAKSVSSNLYDYDLILCELYPLTSSAHDIHGEDSEKFY